MNSLRSFMTNNGRFATALATFCLALLLTACGGGGGGTATGGGTNPTACIAPQTLVNGTCQNPSVTDTTAPVLTVTTSSPASVTTTITVTSNEDLGGNVQIVVKNGATTIAGATTLGAGNRSIVWTPSMQLPYNTALSVTASAVDLAGNTGTVSGTITTVADPTAWWPPTTITPVGVKVFGAGLIPAGCTSWTQQCWKDLVKNGGMKFIETPAVMVGSNSRQIVAPFYQNASGFWNILPTYKDTGEPVGGDIGSGVSIEIDWAQGTTRGFIVHEKVSGHCYEMAWYPPTTQQGVASNIWDSVQVTCP
jgi:hypothetical protein